MINEKTGLELFKEEAQAIGALGNGFSFREKNGRAILYGDLKLLDKYGKLLDSYSIEIYGSNKYPHRFPLVFEVGGRLPHNIDWHVFENDGHCCIRALPEEALLCHKGITIASFIEKELKPYFCNQTFRQINGYYLKERAHGLVLSSIEYFSEILMTKDVNMILKMLTLISNRIELKSTSKCTCGSNRKYKKCHRRAFRKLQLIENYILTEILTKIKEYLTLINYTQNN